MEAQPIRNEQEISLKTTGQKSEEDADGKTTEVETNETQQEVPISSEIDEIERELDEMEQMLKGGVPDRTLQRIFTVSAGSDEDYQQWQPIVKIIADNPFFSHEENAIRTGRIKAQKAECERILNETIVPLLAAKQEEALEQISRTIAQIENVRIERVKLVEKGPIYPTLGEALYRFGKRDQVLPSLQEIAKNKFANNAPEKRDMFTNAVSQLVRIDADRKVAISDLVKHNLALVLSFAKKYIPHENNPKSVSLSLFDVFHEGIIGCTRGVDTYDPDTGYQLSSYISLWIKQSINTAISQQGRTVREPQHLTDMAAKISKAEAALMQTLGRSPTSSEIAKRTGFTQRAIEKREVMHASGSLNEPSRADDSPIQIADQSPGPLEQLLLNVKREKLTEAMQSLTKNERNVLCAIYFSDPDRVLPFREVGERAEEFDIAASKGKKTRPNRQLSYETIRVIATRAIGNLKKKLEEI